MCCNTPPCWWCRVLCAGFIVLACDTARQTPESQSQHNAPTHGTEPSTAQTGPIDSVTSSPEIASTPTVHLSDNSNTSFASADTTATAPGVTTAATSNCTFTRAPREQKPARPTVVAKPVQSPAHEGEGFKVYLQGLSPLVVGQTQAFSVVIEPQAPFKSNDKYPYRFSGLKAQGANVSAGAVTVANVTPSRTTLQVEVTGVSPGPGALEGTLNFSVCTAEKCLVERAALKITFEVTAPN